MAEAQPIPVILCGGIGDRLKPLSTPDHPKQFLPLAQNASLYDLTCARARRLCPDAPLRIVTTAALESLARRQCAQDASYIIEPLRRNTGAAIALAAQNAAPDDILWIMPCDHLIDDEAALQTALAQSLPLAQAGHLVLFGIKPTSPHTGYGYIHTGPHNTIVSFTEKPDLDTAQSYLASGTYVWNSGMIVTRARTLLDEFAALAPAYIEGEAQTRYPHLAPTSVDFLILEQTARACVIPIDMGWQDIGGPDNRAQFETPAKKYAERTE